MPEGDTIFRLAERLRRALAGETIVEAKSAVAEIREGHLRGTTVVDVSSRGKNLLIGLSNGLTLHTHLRMHGAWHVYHRGEKWRMPSFRLRLALATATTEAVCFGAPVVRLIRTERLEADPHLGRLGPDLLADDFDLAEALRRLLESPERPIADALLDQRAVAGIGNVLKSEILFLAKVDPRLEVGALEPARLRSVLELAREVMLRTVIRGRAGFVLPGRVTRVTSRSTLGRGGELWVYERRGEKCLVCATPIEMIRQADARSTYHCPACQRG